MTCGVFLCNVYAAVLMSRIISPTRPSVCLSCLSVRPLNLRLRSSRWTAA